MCVCVCVCACMRACVCVRVRERERELAVAEGGIKFSVGISVNCSFCCIFLLNVNSFYLLYFFVKCKLFLSAMFLC